MISGGNLCLLYIIDRFMRRIVAEWYLTCQYQPVSQRLRAKVDVASLQSCIMAFDLKQQGLDILDIGLQVKWVGGA